MKAKVPILVKFGKIVGEERLKRSLSQEKFAEFVGLYRTYISTIERAEKNLDTLHKRTFAETLNLHLKYPKQYLGEVTIRFTLSSGISSILMLLPIINL